MSTSSELPAFPWIHIGNCPVCDDGLCRVRCCVDDLGEKHLIALCDECEASWLEPDTLAPHLYPDPQEALWPSTDIPLYGPNTRWATLEDIRGTDWEREAIVELPGDVLDDSDGPIAGYYVTAEDTASALDVPPQADSARAKPAQKKSTERSTDDWAYGQDEPRPGC